MNLLAPPVSTIVFSILWGWYGFFGSLMLFYLSYKLWKYSGKVKGSLTFKPKIKWFL